MQIQNPLLKGRGLSMKQMVSLTAHAQTQIPSHHPLLSQLVNVSAAFAPCSSLIPARPFARPLAELEIAVSDAHSRNSVRALGGREANILPGLHFGQLGKFSTDIRKGLGECSKGVSLKRLGLNSNLDWCHAKHRRHVTHVHVLLCH